MSEKIELALLLSKSSIDLGGSLSKDNGSIVLSVVEIREGQIRNGLDKPHSDLVLRGYFDHRDGTARYYGLHTEYATAHCVELKRAEMMVKTLRKVDRAMSKEEVRPVTMGQYATLVARILKVKVLALHVNGSHGSYDDNEYTYFDRREMQMVIDGQVGRALANLARV